MPRQSSTLVSLDENPVRQFRKRAGYSLQGAANRADIRLETWAMVEHGCFTNIPPAVIQVLSDWGADPIYLEREYAIFQLSCRQLLGEKLSWKAPEDISDERVHPFRVWREREGFSRIGFAKLACVNPGVLYALEKFNRRHLPEQLVLALEQMGAPIEFLEEMEFRTVEGYVA